MRESPQSTFMEGRFHSSLRMLLDYCTFVDGLHQIRAEFDTGKMLAIILGVLCSTAKTLMTSMDPP